MKQFHGSPEFKILSEAGLSEREAAIYIAALESGGGSITELAKKAGIERTGIYYHLNGLLGKGLLRTTVKGKRVVFIPADPEILRRIAEQRHQDLLNVLPGFQEKYRQVSARPFAEYFQGTEEISIFYDRVYHILEELDIDSGSVYVLGNSHKTVTTTHAAYQVYTKPERQLPVKIKCILPASQKPKEEKANLKDPYIVTRYNLPPAEIRYIADKYRYPGSVVITHDRIILYDFINTFFSITQNKNLAATWRMFFEYIWDSLKK